MMRYLLTVWVLLIGLQGSGQKLTGQWTGGFNSGGDMFGGRTEYVLELEVNGNDIKGYSYTYFNIIGKRCYVICRLAGSYDKGSKSMVVKEVEKVKSNTPPDFRDCLQTHSLTYMKAEGKELLVGKWRPASEKDNCGTGVTELERKQLVKVVPQTPSKSVAGKNNPPKTTTPSKPKSPSTASKTAPKSTTPKTGTTTRTAPPKPATPPVATEQKNKPETIQKNVPSIEKPKAPSVINSKAISKIDRRSKEIIKTIEVDQRSFRVDLYDNGQIDGDTVSLYLNGRLMVSSQRLSTKPITLNVVIDNDDDEAELVMYAENLGHIPPNTALMVVTVADKRYEVNISSTEQTNGAVKFHLRR